MTEISHVFHLIRALGAVKFIECYLPILWYRYPIPNQLREFWYKERPDILDYMQKAYKDLDIQFLPEKIIKELNHQTILSPSTEILSTETNEFFNNFGLLNEHLQNLVLTYFERL